mgnify:FL=1
MSAEKFFSKIRNTNYIYVILIIGAAVMLFSSLPEKKPAENTQSVSSSVYEEEKLSKILSEIEGAGKVSVMITYYTTAEKAIAYETKNDKKADTSNGFGGESLDEKAVMSKNEPVVLKEIYPAVKGVVVIAEGANSPQVKQALYDAVSTSMGVAIHKICILAG